VPGGLGGIEREHPRGNILSPEKSLNDMCAQKLCLRPPRHTLTCTLFTLSNSVGGLRRGRRDTLRTSKESCESAWVRETAKHQANSCGRTKYSGQEAKRNVFERTDCAHHQADKERVRRVGKGVVEELPYMLGLQQALHKHMPRCARSQDGGESSAEKTLSQTQMALPRKSTFRFGRDELFEVKFQTLLRQQSASGTTTGKATTM
jgi:hypothetical protein